MCKRLICQPKDHSSNKGLAVKIARYRVTDLFNLKPIMGRNRSNSLVWIHFLFFLNKIKIKTGHKISETTNK